MSPGSRLAFVTAGDTSRKTGGHLYNARVLGGLRERGVEVTEIVASGESVEEQRAAAADLGRRLDPASFDVVCVDALARAACAPHLDRWRERVPVAAMVHELPSVARPDESERPDEEPLLRADRLVCVSRHGASTLEARGVDPGRIHIVPPGLDRPPASEPVGTNGGALRALCVAQWIPRKGIAELVRAWNAVRRRLPDGSVLDLIGATDADPAYADRVRGAVGGAEDILVRGTVSDTELRRAYATADLFALPSRYEGYGMVYAEAMSYGLPVLALNTGPVPEVVGEAGLLVEPGDGESFVSALAEALGRALSDEDLRRRLSGAALRCAGELAGWEATVGGFLRALEAAVEQRSPSR